MISTFFAVLGLYFSFVGSYLQETAKSQDEVQNGKYKTLIALVLVITAWTLRVYNV